MVSSLGQESASLVESWKVSVTHVDSPCGGGRGRKEQFSKKGAGSHRVPKRYLLQVENDLLLIQGFFVVASWLSSSYLLCSAIGQFFITHLDVGIWMRKEIK